MQLWFTVNKIDSSLMFDDVFFATTFFPLSLKPMMNDFEEYPETNSEESCWMDFNIYIYIQ